MCLFLEETLKPQVFWTAFAAIGTLSAVLIALFLPLYNEHKRIKRIERLIAREIDRNYDIVKRTSGKHEIKLPTGETTHITLNAEEVTRILKLGLWEEYKYKLADDSPEKYEKYQNINQHIEALSNLYKIEKNLQQVMFNEEISVFLKKCRDELGKI